MRRPVLRPRLARLRTSHRRSTAGFRGVHAGAVTLPAGVAHRRQRRCRSLLARGSPPSSPASLGFSAQAAGAGGGCSGRRRPARLDLAGVMTVGGCRGAHTFASRRASVLRDPQQPLCLPTTVELERGADVVAVLEAALRPGLARRGHWQARPWPIPFLMINGLSLAAVSAASCAGVGATRWSATMACASAGDLRFAADIVALTTASPRRRSWRARWAAPIASCGAATARWRRWPTPTRATCAQVFAIGDGARFGGVHPAWHSMLAGLQPDRRRAPRPEAAQRKPANAAPHGSLPPHLRSCWTRHRSKPGNQ